MAYPESLLTVLSFQHRDTWLNYHQCMVALQSIPVIFYVFFFEFSQKFGSSTSLRNISMSMLDHFQLPTSLLQLFLWEDTVVSGTAYFNKPTDHFKGTLVESDTDKLEDELCRR